MINKPKTKPKVKKKFPVGIKNSTALMTDSIFLAKDESFARYAIRFSQRSVAQRAVSSSVPTTDWVSQEDRYLITTYIPRKYGSRTKWIKLHIYSNELYIDAISKEFEIVFDGNYNYILSIEPIIIHFRDITRKEMRNNVMYVWCRRISSNPKITTRIRRGIGLRDLVSEGEEAHLRLLYDETQKDQLEYIPVDEMLEEDMGIPQRRMRLARLGIIDRIKKRRSMRTQLVPFDFRPNDNPEYQRLLM